MALPLIISCFLHVCLLWSPLPCRIQFIFHTSPPLRFTQNCLYWSPKSSVGSELEEARLWKYCPWEIDLAKEMSTMCPCLLAVLGALSFDPTTGSPLSLCSVRMSVTDCQSGLSDLQRSCVIYSHFWPQKSWVKWISICFGRTDVSEWLCPCWVMWGGDNALSPCHLSTFIL